MEQLLIKSIEICFLDALRFLRVRRAVSAAEWWLNRNTEKIFQILVESKFFQKMVLIFQKKSFLNLKNYTF